VTLNLLRGHRLELVEGGRISAKGGFSLSCFFGTLLKKISPAISEGFNNKIKRLKSMAYGYKDVDYFKLKIHQHGGFLNPGLAT
jgi:hypothetical protein